MEKASDVGGDAGFSFPMLPPPKPPLTARSTVVHATLPEGSPAPPSTSQPTPVAVSGRRNKVPLEKGYSQVDWLRLSQSGKDMTGGHGLQPQLTIEEVKRHKSAEDAWMVLNGRVYNITPYLHFHPGGADILVKAAGRDGTSLFRKWVVRWLGCAAG